MAKQISSYIEPYLSNYLCGFRKGHSTQDALLCMLNNWQMCLNNSGKIGALMMDLSKAFDCLSYDIMISKLDAYGFGIKSLHFLYSYLTNRKQRVKIGCTVSDWLNIKRGVPQGSVLGPILFNIFLNDFILCLDNSLLCNFADDNSLYVCGSTLDLVIEKLSMDIANSIIWFKHNAMVANPEKFQLLVINHKPGTVCVKVGDFDIFNTDTVKLLGVTIDLKLTFNTHVKQVCNTVSNKTRALARIRKHLSQSIRPIRGH